MTETVVGEKRAALCSLTREIGSATQSTTTSQLQKFPLLPTLHMKRKSSTFDLREANN